MPAIMLDRIAGLPIARFQVVSGQTGFEVGRWWHTGVVQRYAATAYESNMLPLRAARMQWISHTPETSSVVQAMIRDERPDGWQQSD